VFGDTQTIDGRGDKCGVTTFTSKIKPVRGRKLSKDQLNGRKEEVSSNTIVVVGPYFL
jgi:hypothetical protein